MHPHTREGPTCQEGTRPRHVPTRRELVERQKGLRLLRNPARIMHYIVSWASDSRPGPHKTPKRGPLMKTPRPLRLLLTSAILVALAAGPLVAVETGVSPKLGLSTYADREGRVTLVVDSYAASLREGEAYVPIRMALGIVGKGKPVRFDSESFTLTDRNGNEVPLASYQDVQRNYDKWLADESVLRTRPMMLDSRFDALD